MEKPRTIHDFFGFSQELYNVQYPALGSSSFAKKIKGLILKTEVDLDYKWGLDHGCWVVKTYFPNAEVSVVELSLDYSQTPQFHYDLAKSFRRFVNGVC